MLVHNASVTENALSASVLLSRPWWALCFDPQTENSHQLSLQSFLFLRVSPSSSTVALLSLLFYQSLTSSTYCLPLPHPLLPLAPGYSPSLPPSLPPCISLFMLWLLSHSQVHVSIMWGCYVSAHSWKLFLLLYHFSFIFTCLTLFSLFGFPLQCISVSLKVYINIWEPSALRLEWISNCIQVFNTDCFQADTHKQTNNRNHLSLCWKCVMNFMQLLINESDL